MSLRPLKKSQRRDSSDMTTEVSFENVLDLVGSRGRWQAILFIITSLTGFFNAFHHLGSMFLAATPDHWCTIPDSDNESLWSANWTGGRVKQYAIPQNEDGTYSSCEIYTRNYTYAYQQPWSEDVADNSSAVKRQCSSWAYDKSIFESTVVTQWDLVCIKAPLASTVQAIYMVGVFFGTLTYGLVSDRFGRRWAILIATSQFIMSGILASIPIHYIWFITFRMLTGMGSGGAFTATYVLMAEFISPQMRDVAGIAYQIPFGLGYMALPGIAYLIRNWTWLQLTISLIDLVLLSYIWLLPESPRWLIGNGRIKDALPVLRMVAKVNCVKVSDKELTAAMEACYETDMERRKGKLQEPSSLSILADLFRTPEMRKRILVSYFIWMSVSVCYYGLSFKTPEMGNNIYLISFLSSLTEIPSYIIGCFIIRYMSRKLNIIGSFVIGGAACLLILAVPSGVDQAVTALAITGKFFINIAYAIVYLYTTEIFPTSNRNVALGTSSMSARIGATGAPFIVDLLGGNTPLIIFGVAACVAGLLCILLPESKDKYLPETVTDVEISRTTTTETLSDVGNSL